MSRVRLVKIATPSAPPAGDVEIFVDTADGLAKQIASDGTVTKLAQSYTPENAANKSTDGTMAANSATLYPSQSAVVTYVGAVMPVLNLTGAKFVAIAGNNLPTGDTDLYTVPTGKKMLLLSSVTRAYQISGGNITFKGQIKVGGVYYQTSIATTMVSGSTTTSLALLSCAAMVLNAGESISINCTTNAGLNIWGEGIEFDAADTRIKTSRILGLSNGNNTMYTVPVGKSAFRLSYVSGTSLSIFNGTAGNLAYIPYVLTNGTSVGTASQALTSTTINAGAQFASLLQMPTLNAGDSIVLSTSGGSAGQNAFLTYFEI